ncbi:hypothetical protein HNR23_001732 [Nocardiopsis mwathae]|uniref:Uncharacterized protein n=1 Tax=Nocardiopsis mwathae TaxID=1472723 RepID=A0A7W9YGI7_9ACTN|nr:hypothetical protein [Nocardiopsis mwathae]MBB6171672.1 hypothetical protein [Nocardiopsis mwathae]
MSEQTPPRPTEDLDLITHSPDGESRGIDFRAGDIFPMDPRPHQRLKIDEPASAARPWGLRFLHTPKPRAGKRGADTSEFTTGGGQDNQNPEDWDKD